MRREISIIARDVIFLTVHARWWGEGREGAGGVEVG